VYTELDVSFFRFKEADRILYSYDFFVEIGRISESVEKLDHRRPRLAVEVQMEMHSPLVARFRHRQVLSLFLLYSECLHLRPIHLAIYYLQRSYNRHQSTSQRSRYPQQELDERK
jgi:hypothetical protein